MQTHKNGQYIIETFTSVVHLWKDEDITNYKFIEQVKEYKLDTSFHSTTTLPTIYTIGATRNRNNTFHQHKR